MDVMEAKEALEGLLKADKSGGWSGVLESLAKRPHEDSTRLEALMDAMPEPNRGAAIWIGRELARLGLCRFIPGRRGLPTRLEWLCQSDSVGKVVQGETEAVVLAEMPRADEAGEEAPAVVLPIPHSFWLRYDELVRFTLPANLTQQEAGRLSDYIRSLPFG